MAAPKRIFTHYLLCEDPSCEGHLMRIMNRRLPHYHREGAPNLWVGRDRRGSTSAVGPWEGYPFLEEDELG